MYNQVLSSVALSPTTDILKSDSGASRTYIQPKHQKYLTNKQFLHDGPTATLPNNENIKSNCSRRFTVSQESSYKSVSFSRFNERISPFYRSTM